MFLRALSMQFREPYQNYSTKSWKHLAQGSKKKLNQPIFSIRFAPKFPPFGTKNAVLTTLPRFFSDTRPNLFTSMSITERNTIFFQKEAIFLKSQSVQQDK